MATTYSPEFKASIIAKMLPPNNVPVPQLTAETNIPKDTLYAWRGKARQEALGAAVSDAPTQGLSSEEKFAVVLESAALNEVELGEYCRRKGLYPQEIAAWRESCRQANRAVSTRTERAEVRAYKQEIQTLERELLRKDKALAEAAALLVLEKKVQTLFGDSADARSPLRSANGSAR
jgi:transposase-like protein